MGHGEHKLPDKFTGMIADNAYTQNSVCTRHGQHFDEPVRFTVSQCPVMMIELIAGQLIANLRCCASCSLKPTRATSGLVNVAHGTTR